MCLAFEASLYENVFSAKDYFTYFICWSSKQAGNLFKYLNIVRKIIMSQINVQVFERLQKLNICMSHQVTVSLLNTVGLGYDTRVFQWRDSLLSNLENVAIVSMSKYIR